MSHGRVEGNYLFVSISHSLKRHEETTYSFSEKLHALYFLRTPLFQKKFVSINRLLIDTITPSLLEKLHTFILKTTRGAPLT